MSRRRGRRYDDTPKLNKKKVFATIIAIIVFIMIIVSLKNLFSSNDNTKDVSSLTTYLAAYENSKWGVIDNKGNKIIEFNNDEMVIVPDKNKALFICAQNTNYSNETYTTKVINEKGEKILTEFNNVQPIENTDGSNVWYESNILKYEKDNKYGLINFDGKEILAPIYDNIYALQGIEKSVIAEKDGKKGLVSTSMGEVIIPVEYTDITSLTKKYEDGYIVKNDAGKLGIISPDKTTTLETAYDEIRNVTGNGYYVVVQNGTLEIVNKKGEVILNNGFETVVEINADNFVITVGGKYGVISKSGETVIEAKYEDLKFAFSDNYIAKLNGKYGIINTSSNEVVGFNYERINYVSEADFFTAEKGSFTTDILNSSFETVLNSIIVSDLNIDDGYLRVRKDGEYKYYNLKLEEKTNKEVLTTNTLFLVKEDGKYGYENKNGKRVVDCIYDDAKEQNEFGFCAVNKDGKWGVLGSNGAVILEPSLNLDDYLYINFIGDWHKHKDLQLNIYTK